MCGRVFVIAVLASLGVPSVAEEIAAVAVGASAQLAKVGKHVVEAASDVTPAMPGAVNAGDVETGKEALVRSKLPLEAGKEQQEGEANEDQVAKPAKKPAKKPAEEKPAKKPAKKPAEEDEDEDEEEDEDKEWARLSPEEKDCWKELGWNKKSWDGEEEPGDDTDKAWEELSSEQRACAKDLAFSEKTWDGLWGALSPEEQSSWEKLGLSEKSWDVQERAVRLAKAAAGRMLGRHAGGKDWKDLSKDEQAAAKHIGFSKKTWDDSE